MHGSANMHINIRILAYVFCDQAGLVDSKCISTPLLALQCVAKAGCSSFLLPVSSFGFFSALLFRVEIIEHHLIVISDALKGRKVSPLTSSIRKIYDPLTLSRSWSNFSNRLRHVNESYEISPKTRSGTHVMSSDMQTKSVDTPTPIAVEKTIPSSVPRINE